VIQRDGLNWRVSSASTHARQLVAVFQVLCSLYRLTCVGYAQTSLEFISRSLLIHAKKNLVIQGDSKRWNQLKSKQRLNTRQTVGCGIPSSLLALRVDLHGLRSKVSWIRLKFSSDTRGRPEILPLHRQPICSNWWFQRQMLFLVGGWMLKRRRNARCTAVADWVLMNSRTQKNIVLHSSHFVLNWRCCTTVRYASPLAVKHENLGPPLSNVM